MRRYLFFTALTCLSVAVSSCGKLSREGREITGRYYNIELSQTEPVMELHPDATCLIRAIKPGVLNYSVEGTWNVERDSLIIWLDRSTLMAEGDATLVGDIPSRYARKIAGRSDFNLQLEQDGVVYMYQRRSE